MAAPEKRCALILRQKKRTKFFSERPRRCESFPESLPSWTAREWKQGVFLLLDLHTLAAQRVLAQKQRWGLHLRYSGGQSTKSKRRSCSYRRERPKTSSPQGSFRTRIFVTSERPFSAVWANFASSQAISESSRWALHASVKKFFQKISLFFRTFKTLKCSWIFF